MIGIGALTLLTPLLALWSYRRAGARWSTVGALTVLAILLTLAAGFIAIFYWFGFVIESGLCGRTPGWASAAALGAYAIVATWAAARPSRVWAWPLAVGAAAAIGLLVAYFFDSAHAYCET